MSKLEALVGKDVSIFQEEEGQFVARVTTSHEGEYSQAKAATVEEALQGLADRISKAVNFRSWSGFVNDLPVGTDHRPIEMASELISKVDLAPIEKLFASLEDITILTYANGDWHEEKEDEDEPQPKRLVVVFSFAEKGFGFGEITIVRDEDGQTYIDTECMSRDTVKRILGRLVDSAIVDRETDPDRHQKYNAAMRRVCAPQCDTCHPKEK